MSLIQEALKRQQMEQEGKIPSPPPADIPKTTPYAPPPLDKTDVSQVTPNESPRHKTSLRIRDESVTITEEDQKPGNASDKSATEDSTVNAQSDSVRISPSNHTGKEKPNRIWPVLLTTLLVLTLLLGAVIWAVIIGLDWAGVKTPWQSAPASELSESLASPEPPSVMATDIPEPVSPKTDAKPFQVSTEPVSPKETVAPPSPTVSPKPPQPRKGVAQQPESEPSKQPLIETGSKVIPPTPPSTAVEDAPPISKPVSKAETTIRETITQQPPPPVEATTPAPRMWPDLDISGVVGNNQKGAAFINGKVIGVNESILNVKVLGIRQQSVLLEYEGETRLVKVGQPVNRR